MSPCVGEVCGTVTPARTAVVGCIRRSFYELRVAGGVLLWPKMFSGKNVCTSTPEVDQVPLHSRYFFSTFMVVFVWLFVSSPVLSKVERSNRFIRLMRSHAPSTAHPHIGEKVFCTRYLAETMGAAYVGWRSCRGFIRGRRDLQTLRR